MCLAIPGKILNIESENEAIVDFDGIMRNVSLDMLPSAKVNDYVLVHAGFAIEIVNKTEAKKTLELYKELNGGGNE